MRRSEFVACAHLIQDTGGEERNNREDGDDTHISDEILERMLAYPENDGQDTDEAHPILLECEPVSGWPNGFDFNIPFSVW